MEQPGMDAGQRDLVLIVDDDVLLSQLQQRWLENEGFAVTVCHDGSAGLDALSTSLPDVVCLDVMMPGMDGFEVLERIRERHPLLPVIMMTAQTAADSAVRAMKAGAYDYLVKPVEQAKFLAEVSHAAERSRLWNDGRASSMTLEKYAPRRQTSRSWR